MTLESESETRRVHKQPIKLCQCGSGSHKTGKTGPEMDSMRGNKSVEQRVVKAVDRVASEIQELLGISEVSPSDLRTAFLLTWSRMR
jgi:hypothetical protein